VQEENGERQDADLGDDDQPAACREPPHAPVPERVDEVAERLALPGRRLPQTDRARDRGGEARGGQGEEPRLRTARGGDRRQRYGGRRAAQRQRGLPDSEGEAALRRIEPPHHGAPARGVDARAGSPGDDEEEDERNVAGRERREGERDARHGEAGGENAPLPDPVGEQPPGEQGADRADAEGRQHDSDLGQREAELVPKLRRQHGDPEEDRGVARLGRRPEREDRPPVPAHAARLSSPRIVETPTRTRHDGPHTRALYVVRLGSGWWAGVPREKEGAGAAAGDRARPPVLAAAALLVPAGEAVPARLRPGHLRAAARAGRLGLSLVGRQAAGGHGGLGLPHSHSIVAGGFEERSSATRFTPGISLMIRLEMVSSRS
jgi:hypothetical protein